MRLGCTRRHGSQLRADFEVLFFTDQELIPSALVLCLCETVRPGESPKSYLGS